jgi:hypothetical protein
MVQDLTPCEHDEVGLVRTIERRLGSRFYLGVRFRLRECYVRCQSTSARSMRIALPAGSNSPWRNDVP